jgi:hypothetical protein
VGRLELELSSEPVHDRVDRTDVEPFREQRPNQMACVERSLARERLGIDHEPGLALGGEHVPQMEVPVDQDRLLGRVREVAGEIDRRSEEPFVEGPILSNEPPGELVRQPRGEIADGRERMIVANRSPQTPQQRAGDPDRLRTIGVVSERCSGLQPFE